MKDKYTTYVLPRLVEVLDWARAGAGLKEIAARLGVSTTTLRSWIKKGRAGEKEYVPLCDAVSAGRERPEQVVEEALLKRAVGYQFDEVTQEEKLDRDGNIHVLTKTVTKDVPPHLTSIMYYLSNRVPVRWGKEAEGSNRDKGVTGVVELPPAKMPTPSEGNHG